MLRAMSSHVYIKRRLHPGLLDAMVRGGAQALEIFAARGHFNYHDKEHVKEVGNWFKSEKIEFHSIHAPIYMDNNFHSGGQPVNIVDPDKRNRIDAMDEIKRAIEVAEYVPFRYLIQHIGKTDEYDDPRKFENAIRWSPYRWRQLIQDQPDRRGHAARRKDPWRILTGCDRQLPSPKAMNSPQHSPQRHGIAIVAETLWYGSRPL